jgi:hypothetical protein
MLVDSAEDEDDDWCHTTTDGGFPAPNETVHPPFALSASDAVWRLMSSVHYATLSRNHKLLGVSTDVGCARGCDPWRRECGYSLLIEVDRGGLEGVSSHLEYDYVGPFDGTVQFQIRSREKSRDLDDRKSLSDIAPRRRP